MAMLFELVVNFGRDAAAVASAKRIVESADPLRIRGIEIPLAGPSISGDGVEFTVGARGIQYGGPRDPQLDVRDLTDAEISELGDQFYQLLRSFHGYKVAIVGWDPEEVVDLRELVPRLAESGLYRLDGIVIADELAEDWDVAPELERFAPGYRWSPYRGTHGMRSAGPGVP